MGLPVSFWLPICIMAAVAFWGDRIELSARLRLVIQLGLMVERGVGSMLKTIQTFQNIGGTDISFNADPL